YLPEENELIESEALKNDAADNLRLDGPGPIQPALIEPTHQARFAAATSTADVLANITGVKVDAPLCMTCGTKMRPSGSCYVCEGCGSTSGCS
ncbi:MAG: hypothetical protein LBI99_06270, partial [Propionibacteriaceae bacterium]|nr:hypothetical protein [Propionibacteriaceae bacterium]